MGAVVAGVVAPSTVAAAMAYRWELWQVRQPFQQLPRPALLLWPHAMAFCKAEQAELAAARH